MASEAVRDFFWLMGLLLVPVAGMEILIESLVLGLVGLIKRGMIRVVLLIFCMILFVSVILLMPREMNQFGHVLFDLLKPVKAWSIFLYWFPLIGIMVYNMRAKKVNILVSIAVGIGGLIAGAILYLILGMMVGAETD